MNHGDASPEDSDFESRQDGDGHNGSGSGKGRHPDDPQRHHLARQVREIQLRAIPPGKEFHTRFLHAALLLREDTKVRVTLRFRGRDNLNKEAGIQIIADLIAALEPWGSPETTPQFKERSIRGMLVTLPRDVRAPSPLWRDN